MKTDTEHLHECGAVSDGNLPLRYKTLTAAFKSDIKTLLIIISDGKIFGCYVTKAIQKPCDDFEHQHSFESYLFLWALSTLIH